jgi:C-terminal processing protease CtpA/Prc
VRLSNFYEDLDVCVSVVLKKISEKNRVRGLLLDLSHSGQGQLLAGVDTTRKVLVE